MVLENMNDMFELPGNPWMLQGSGTYQTSADSGTVNAGPGTCTSTLPRAATT